MKKLFRAIGIILVLVILILAGLAVFVRSYLKSDRLKALIIPRIESYTGMDAEIKEIKVSLLKGIVVKDMSLSEKETKRPFLKAEEFVLDYELLPLFKRHLIIESIELNSPSVLIVRKADGTFNFSPLLKKKPEVPEEKKPRELPMDIAANKIDINNARVDFKDEQKAIPDILALFDSTFKLSFDREIAYSGRIDLKSMKALAGGIQTETSGKIDVDDVINLKLDTAVGQDNIALSGVIKNYRASPDISLNISSEELHLERLLALGKKPARPAPKKAKKPMSPPSAMMQKVTASGKISIKNAPYKEYRIKDFALSYKLVKGALSVIPVSGSIRGGQKAYVEGTFRAGANMSLRSADIAGTLAGSGTLDLARVVMRPTRLTEQVAAISGISALRSPSFEKSQFSFDIKNKKVDIDGSLLSPDIKAEPVSGTVGFNKNLAMTFDVQLSPAFSARMPAGRIGQFLRNEEGWTVIPFIAGGTVSNPSVSLNRAALGKGVQRELKKEIEKRLLEKIAPKKEGQPSGPGDILRDIFK